MKGPMGSERDLRSSDSAPRSSWEIRGLTGNHRKVDTRKSKGSPKASPQGQVSLGALGSSVGGLGGFSGGLKTPERAHGLRKSSWELRGCSEKALGRSEAAPRKLSGALRGSGRSQTALGKSKGAPRCSKKALGGGGGPRGLLVSERALGTSETAPRGPYVSFLWKRVVCLEIRYTLSPTPETNLEHLKLRKQSGVPALLWCFSK